MCLRTEKRWRCLRAAATFSRANPPSQIARRVEIQNEAQSPRAAEADVGRIAQQKGPKMFQKILDKIKEWLGGKPLADADLMAELEKRAKGLGLNWKVS